jgi:hypothetical protein
VTCLRRAEWTLSVQLVKFPESYVFVSITQLLLGVGARRGFASEVGVAVLIVKRLGLPGLLCCSTPLPSVLAGRGRARSGGWWTGLRFS